MNHSKNELLPYLEQYGSHCMAYTSLEPQMEYFVVDSVGYLSYISFKHWMWSWKERKIVLADPICAEENYKEIISQFVNQHPDVIFVQTSKVTARVLDQLGYQVNLFGVENEIPLTDFCLSGKHRAKLRQWKNKCLREGVNVKEIDIEKCDNTDHENKGISLDVIKNLSDTWLKSKGGNGLSLLVRPFRLKKEKDVRYFWAFKDNKLIGMALFDPIYRDGKVVGYYHNIDRLSESAPHGTSATIMLEAIEIFREEGCELVSLGMSPMHIPDGLQNEFNYHPFTRKGFRYAFRKLNFLYSFKGNLSHKKKFGGIHKPIYISSTNGTNLKEVFVMMKAIGMI